MIPPGTASRGLTPRQQEIAHLVRQGLSNKHIAKQLRITEGTVKSHLVQIYEKLGIDNRTKLAMLERVNGTTVP